MSLLTQRVVKATVTTKPKTIIAISKEEYSILDSQAGCLEVVKLTPKLTFLTMFHIKGTKV